MSKQEWDWPQERPDRPYVTVDYHPRPPKTARFANAYFRFVWTAIKILFGAAYGIAMVILISALITFFKN